MGKIDYNDGLCPAGRTPRLYLAKGSETVKFMGKNISGFCAVAAAQYEKNGKWSNTSYQLNLAPGVRDLYFLSPMHGTWGDNLASWGEVAEKLSLPLNVVQSIIRTEYKETAERLDKLEEFALSVEAKGETTEVVIISFGSPSNRAISEGYWLKPKSSQSSDGRTVTVTPKVDDECPDWSNSMVIEPCDGKIISSVHSPGMHGGYWTIEVIVPLLRR